MQSDFDMAESFVRRPVGTAMDRSSSRYRHAPDSIGDLACVVVLGLAARGRGRLPAADGPRAA